MQGQRSAKSSRILLSEDPTDLYSLAFGEDSQDQIYGDAAHSAIAGLLGFAADEIDLVQ